MTPRPRRVPAHGCAGFFERLWDFVTQLDDVSGDTLAVGLGSLVLVLAIKRYARDLLSRVAPESPVRAYPTVRAAVADLTRSS
jgi:hypothetical protein